MRIGRQKRKGEEMLVKIYTDGAARGNPDAPADTAVYLNMWIQKENCM